jgi:hypothetical protein
VSKKFLHNFYFCSKHHARLMSYRLVLSVFGAGFICEALVLKARRAKE